MKRAQLIVTTCDRRAFEVEQTKQFLNQNGYLVSDDHKKVDTRAELIVLFTCGFTQAAEDLGLDLLKKIEKAKRTGTTVVFGGCIPAINPERTSKEFHGPSFRLSHTLTWMRLSTRSIDLKRCACQMSAAVLLFLALEPLWMGLLPPSDNSTIAFQG